MRTGREMNRQYVTLMVTSDRDTDEPALWDWEDVLGQSVELVAASPCRIVMVDDDVAEVTTTVPLADILTAEEVEEIDGWVNGDMDITEIPDEVLRAIDLAVRVSST